MLDELLHIRRRLGLDKPYPVAIWCIDRPDAVARLRDDPAFSQIPIREWRASEMAMDGKPRWMNWMPPGVYVEMSNGLPVIVKM